MDTAALDSATVTALAAGDEGTVTLEWDTNGAEAGEHTLRVLAQTEGRRQLGQRQHDCHR